MVSSGQNGVVDCLARVETDWSREGPICARCGSLLSPMTAPQGLCGACLLSSRAAELADGDHGDPPRDVSKEASFEGDVPRLRPGTRLGPYDILSFVGSGGMGEVYRGHDRRLDRDVAIKIIAAHGARFPKSRERFEREAKVIARLNHPHICTIYDVGACEGIDFIVMEIVEGESLAERLARGALPLDDVLRYAVHIADALDKAHQQGIVHRDLKPGNIYLTSLGAKLLDFGLATLASGRWGDPTADGPLTSRRLTDHGAVPGTWGYMAPEQLVGRDVDHRSDLFAFGLVAYEMLTGRPAFEADTRSGLMAAILDTEPPAIATTRPDVPAAL